LYQCRLARKLSQWITDFPVRDNLMEPILEKYAKGLSDADQLKLMNAYKLFDWTVRNIALEAVGSSVEELTSDPRTPVDDNGMGYGYLPWETLLFSAGDFIERGRVFNVLAAQQGIETVWLSVAGADEGADSNAPGKLWTIGVLIGNDCLLFEPKLGMPILDPDKVELATLAQTLDNDRILRRLDLAGQFNYALEKADVQNFEFLIDAPPTAASARMKMLEQVLLGDERMVLYRDLDALAARLEAIAPGHAVQLWETPLLAQIQAAAVRERMATPSPYSMSYMAKHGVWLMDTSAASGRRKHLVGEFENTLDAEGALKTYMNSRIDDETLAKLPYDPDVQHALGVPQVPGEPKEQHEARIAQAQYIMSLSKFAAHYLLAQLHFDRGNYQASEDFWVKRVLDDPRAQNWWAAGHYTLARIYQETGRLDKAAEELSFEGSPQAAGNRLRLRYLRREE
jgi:tetratricopeptide (TPR) repeat protein